MDPFISPMTRRDAAPQASHWNCCRNPCVVTFNGVGLNALMSTRNHTDKPLVWVCPHQLDAPNIGREGIEAAWTFELHAHVLEMMALEGGINRMNAFCQRNIDWNITRTAHLIISIVDFPSNRPYGSSNTSLSCCTCNHPAVDRISPMFNSKPFQTTDLLGMIQFDILSTSGFLWTFWVHATPENPGPSALH